MLLSQIHISKRIIWISSGFLISLVKPTWRHIQRHLSVCWIEQHVPTRCCFSIGTVLFHCLQMTFHCLCICLSYMEMNFAWHRWSCDMAELSHFEDSYTSRNNQCACAVSTWQKWLKPRVRKLLQPEPQCRSGSTFWNCLYLVHLMRMGSPYDLRHALTSLRHHFYLIRRHLILRCHILDLLVRLLQLPLQYKKDIRVEL